MKLVLYGVSSPYAADAVETAARLGWELAACVRNVAAGEAPPELPSVLDAGELTPELLALPFLVPLMKPGRGAPRPRTRAPAASARACAMVDPTADGRAQRADRRGLLRQRRRDPRRRRRRGRRLRDQPRRLDRSPQRARGLREHRPRRRHRRRLPHRARERSSASAR